MNHSIRPSLLPFVYVCMALSFVVFIEPSPYDVLMCLLILFGWITSSFVYTKALGVPIVLMFIFSLSNIVSAYYSTDYNGAIFYFLITLYLIFSWLCIASLATRYRIKLIQTIGEAYTLVACLSVVVGTLAYFHFIPSHEWFLQYGRVKGLFKDPNVFGPYLVPAALYCLYKADRGEGRVKWGAYTLFLCLALGILLSFSRAAWGNFALSGVVYFLFTSTVPMKNRIGTVVMSTCIAVPSLYLLSRTPAIATLLQQRMSIQRYDEDRFATQQVALSSGLQNPLGMGPGQSEVNFDLSTHSLYARLITENGVIGFISFLVFFLLSIGYCYVQIQKASSPHRGWYVIVFASLVGLLFNSFFVDTLHWRHLWLMLGLAWCPALVERKEEGHENRSIYHKDG
ncbi:polymerase [Pontibacillus halophilus JSM 076056 = DSM 19796]|uniref:Polymerase n=1 Tax=Pontibacillus halophilus JSM 076056 = DSM 19796 TaxID=1385510 RepID=A0A0A5GM42_9BACI|nr:polymerase [Pontibacillus halophilus JSM 076056 = DSM 19796]